MVFIDYELGHLKHASYNIPDFALLKRPYQLLSISYFILQGVVSIFKGNLDFTWIWVTGLLNALLRAETVIQLVHVKILIVEDLQNVRMVIIILDRFEEDLG